MNEVAAPSHWLRLPVWATVLPYAGLTAVLMVSLGLREPFSDQWRQQVPLLEQELPGSVLGLESGHRQILPNLVRLMDLAWTQGRGELLAWTGALLFAATFGVLAWTLHRGRGTWTTARWLAFASVALGAGFLAQGRMLLHPNESVQVGGVYLGLGVALRALAAGSGWRGLSVALLAATAATFCFGTGFAVHGTVLAMLLVRRRPVAQVGAAATVGAGVLWLYRSVLPAGDEVAASTAFAPLPLIVDLLRWLGAPWVQVFFGLADPTFQAGIAGAVQQRGPHGALWVQLATAVARPLGATTTMHAAGSMCGCAGLLLMLMALWRTLRTAHLPDAGPRPVRHLGLGLCLFGAMAGGLVCLARTDYFARHPEQLFAERYLVWSCLFWSGLCTFFLAGSARPRTVAVGALLVPALAVLLWPVQRAWISWAVAMRTQVERTALALRLQIDDPAGRPLPEDLGGLPFARCIAPVRARRLQMFAEPGVPELGARLAPPDVPAHGLARLPPPRERVITATGTFLHAGIDLASAVRGAPGQEWPLVRADGTVVGRLRADEGHAAWRLLPQPLVSRRGNVYLLADAAGAPTWVVAASPPHRVLAEVAAAR